MEKKKFKLNMHLVLALVIIVILFLIVRKFLGFFRYITQEEIDAISVPEDAQMQDLDYIIPLVAEDDGTFPEDDGVLTVLCLGNGAFADDKSSPDNPCNLFAQSTGATVYNCAIADSYLSAANPTFDASSEPMDAFSLFWLTSIFILKRQELVSDTYAALGDVPADIKESISTLQNLDLRTVDMVYIMFDGSDFLAGRSPAADSSNPSDLQTFGGSLFAGVSLIQEYMPWARIVVMSPTYAYGVAEDGSYISSDSKIYGTDKLSNFAIEEYYIAEAMDISFVDCLYGGVHEDIARDYLTDNLNLNKAGKALLAKRMEDALDVSHAP